MEKLAMVSDVEPHNAALTSTRAWRASPGAVRESAEALGRPPPAILRLVDTAPSSTTPHRRGGGR